MKTVTVHQIKVTHTAIGWGVLAVALLTYMLTLEPTVSYWDCPEYVTCAYGVQPGHPPGNPVWMLAARMFINFAPSTEYIPLMVNAMSGVCAALTVLLTFLATSILTGALLPAVNAGRWSLGNLILREGAGVTAALALCWSDTFWFSAVEAEVYSFSSLTTALLFWLTLVWNRKAHEPHADRYLIAIAYLLGLSIGVHELNLLCLPALLLIVAFRLRGSLRKRAIFLIMLAAIVAIGLVLYGLIPGFISLAARMELLCVNRLGLPFNSGLTIWWIIVMLLFGIALASINTTGTRRSRMITIALCTLATGCSGLFFFSGNMAIGITLTLIAGATLALKSWNGTLRYRSLRISMWGMAMVLLGFSSYGVLIIRASARTPLNTGEPSDIFAFQRYFSREQYGKAPLIYGAAYTAPPQRMRSWIVNDDRTKSPTYTLYRTVNPRKHIVRAVPGMKAAPRSSYATAQDTADNAHVLAASHGYLINSYDYNLEYPREFCMWFPRMHSHSPYDVNGYPGWSGADSSTMLRLKSATLAVDSAGNPVPWPGAPESPMLRPTYMQNFNYLMTYQIGFMYWRYFLWNFVGRQNDYTGRGEPDCGNFITGVTAIDEAMLDNITEAPEEIASGNRGRNIYYFLPLLLGIAGIVAQCRSGVAGRRQALVLLILFIMTGLAIVIYLNQGPSQARDRDYSFAGSFYAWCIWMGLGVICLWQALCHIFKNHPTATAITAVVAAMCVPAQMLSQTADDHDRSGRTAARDLAANQLSSFAPGAILFAAEDNYLFPLVYMQHVEGMRPDVRMVSLPYLVTPWYSRQLRLPLRDGSRLKLTGPEGLLASSYLTNVALGSDMEWQEALPALRQLYKAAASHNGAGFIMLPTPRLFIDMQGDTLHLDLTQTSSGHTSYLRIDQLIALDLIATNAAGDNPRPMYIVSSVANSLFGGQLKPYLRQVGTVSQIAPGNSGLDAGLVARLAMRKWKYGNAGQIPTPYFDPVAAHNLSVQRRVIINAAATLAYVPETAHQAAELLRLVEREMPAHAAPYEAIPDPADPSCYTTEGLLMARAWQDAATALGDPEMERKATSIRNAEIARLRHYRAWRCSLRPAYRPYVSFRAEHLIDALDALENK